MKNIYDGIAVLDTKGEADVELPSSFGTLNSDLRYQLTCIGAYAPVYIDREIIGNRFRIGGGAPGMKVSWQVTGIRQDPWAVAIVCRSKRRSPPVRRGISSILSSTVNLMNGIFVTRATRHRCTMASVPGAWPESAGRVLR